MALIDQDDSFYTRCVTALSTLPAEPLLTTWPSWWKRCTCCGGRGSPAQEELWGYRADELVVLHTPEAGEWERMRTLMRQYHDAPMDLADASFVVTAERLRLRRIFTLDSHFHAYRIDGTHPFDIVPLR